MNYRFEKKLAAIGVCAALAVACESGMPSPVSPSAVVGGGANALNADGSTLKVNSPLAVTPLMEQTNTSLTPVLAARASSGLYLTGATASAGLSHRFQVADSDAFTNIVATGTGETDASGVTRYTVSPALTANKRYVWRVRAELGDGFGPWSNVMAFTTTTGVATAPPTTTGGDGTGTTTTTGSTGPREADPAPGGRIPLPDLNAVGNVIRRFSDARDSCPRGLKYVNNPWQDRVIDALRQLSTRWGYNGKPTRTAADNSGVPVTAAGDEAAFHYTGGPDEGSREVYLIDMLQGHCGTAPTIIAPPRNFTGEEPGVWRGLGRF